MLKKMFLFIGVCVVWSNSFVFANYLDEAFTGDTLVVGGITKNDPDRVSINLSGADINGSGWDRYLIKQLTPNKYNHVLFEHVGMSLRHVDKDGDFSFGMAKLYFNILAPGGSFDFLSWGFFLDDATTYLRICLGCNSCFPNVVLSYDLEKNVFVFDSESSSLSDVVKEKLFDEVQNNSHITNTIHELVNAGFVDIKVKREQDGVLGFTRSHGSLHISAKKPE